MKNILAQEPGVLCMDQVFQNNCKKQHADFYDLLWYLSVFIIKISVPVFLFK